MSTEYLCLAVVILLLRALFASGERAMRFSSFALQTGLQVLALGMMRIDSRLIIVAVALVAVNTCGFFLEKREGALNLVRFAVAITLLVGLSFLGPIGSSLVRFADWTLAVSLVLGHSSLLLAGLDSHSLRVALAILSGVLFASGEVNNLTRFILVRLHVAPGKGVFGDTTQLRRGKTIGIIERLLVYFFVLTQNTAAVGFVVAAKGFARFRELENRVFAEYVLIGTLLSVSSAVLVAILTGIVLKSL